MEDTHHSLQSIDHSLLRTTDVTGEVTLPSGTEMVMPGDDGKFSVKLITPIAMRRI